jgi:hypothetical protein
VLRSISRGPRHRNPRIRRLVGSVSRLQSNGLPRPVLAAIIPREDRRSRVNALSRPLDDSGRRWVKRLVLDLHSSMRVLLFRNYRLFAQYLQVEGRRDIVPLADSLQSLELGSWLERAED